MTLFFPFLLKIYFPTPTLYILITIPASTPPPSFSPPTSSFGSSPFLLSLESKEASRGNNKIKYHKLKQKVAHQNRQNKPIRKRVQEKAQEADPLICTLRNPLKNTNPEDVIHTQRTCKAKKRKI